MNCRYLLNIIAWLKCGEHDHSSIMMIDQVLNHLTDSFEYLPIKLTFKSFLYKNKPLKKERFPQYLIQVQTKRIKHTYLVKHTSTVQPGNVPKSLLRPGPTFPRHDKCQKTAALQDKAQFASTQTLTSPI